MLVILSAFVLPAFLGYGYLVRSLTAVTAGEEEPPTFDEWEELLVDDLQAFVVGFVYGVVPVVLAVAFLVPVSVTVGTGGVNAPSGVLAGLGVLAFLVLVVVAIVVTWVIMAALSTFAVGGRLGDAFDFRTIGRLVTSGPYVAAVALAFVIQIALGVALVAAIVFTFALALRARPPRGVHQLLGLPRHRLPLGLPRHRLPFGTAYREAMVEAA